MKKSQFALKVDSDPTAFDRKNNYLFNVCRIRNEIDYFISEKSPINEDEQTFELRGDLLDMMKNMKFIKRSSGDGEISLRSSIQMRFNPFCTKVL